jgi:integrase
MRNTCGRSPESAPCTDPPEYGRDSARFRRNADARAAQETKIIERFTEHDLRGKVGSDAESLERARQLLGHADSKITERVYLTQTRNRAAATLMRRQKINPMGQLPIYGTAPLLSDAGRARKILKIKA